jgi:hypothetical protein
MYVAWTDLCIKIFQHNHNSISTYKLGSKYAY